MMHATLCGSGTIFPTSVLLVDPFRNDAGIVRIVSARGDLPLQRSFVGAFEMAQRFRADLADAGVLIAFGENVFLAARLDARQRQFLAEDLRHLFHRQFDFEDVAARLIAGFRLAVALCAVSGWPTSPSPWPTPPEFFWPYRNCGISIYGNGMLTRSRPFLPIISPRLMYLLRLLLTLPRTIFRNRWRSRSIFCPMALPRGWSRKKPTEAVRGLVHSPLNKRAG